MDRSIMFGLVGFCVACVAVAYAGFWVGAARETPAAPVDCRCKELPAAVREMPDDTWAVIMKCKGNCGDLKLLEDVTDADD